MTDSIKPIVYHYKVDARGLICPLPLLKMKQCLNKAGSGQTVWLIATDPSSSRDILSFIKQTQHTMLAENSAKPAAAIAQSADAKKTLQKSKKKTEKEFHFYITKA